MKSEHDNPSYEGDLPPFQGDHLPSDTDRPSFVEDHPPSKTDRPPVRGNTRPDAMIPKLVLLNTATETRRQRRHMTIDIVCVGLAFFFLFTSYQSMQNLQSSINPSIGTTSLSVIYTTMVVSSAFVPTWLIKKLGTKNTMALCTFGYTAYIAAQFYPTPYTLLPTAALLGLGAAPLWSAKCTYLTQVGNKYAELTEENTEVVITRFFGIFFLFFQSSQVVGNLISSTVLAIDGEIRNSSDVTLDYCGAQYCQQIGGGNTTSVLVNEVSTTERYVMSSIYLVSALMSTVVVLIFVSPLTKYGEATRVGSSTGRTSAQQVVATFGHMKNPYQLLIAPLTIWSGVEQAFIAADYTAAYVSCGLGVHMVGYTMISFGVCDATCSFFCSRVVARTGRLPVFLLAGALNLSLVLFLLFWAPQPDQIVIFFVVPALWGIADAVWQTQINALYGALFPEDMEAAFSNYNLWESLGFIIAYTCSTQMCIDYKLYLLIAFLSSGMVGYLIVEGIIIYWTFYVC